MFKILSSLSKQRAKDKPNAINVDGLGAYRKGYTKNFWVRYPDKRPSFFQEVGLRGTRSNNPVERLHGTLKDRTKPIRGLGSNRTSSRHKIETIENVLKGWDVHYNFVRPHSALSGKTPAQVAGINIINDGWGDLIGLATVYKTRQELTSMN